MIWKKYWKEKPNKDGIFLCQIEKHYGIFQYDMEKGKFEPNDWFEHVGVNNKSSFHGHDENIYFWVELPPTCKLNDCDISELKEIEKQQKRNEREKRKILKGLS